MKLDERECRLFGLDLTPDAALANVPYVKRIILEDASSVVPSDAGAASSNGSMESGAIWGHGGWQATHVQD